MSLHRSFAALFCAIALTACEKNAVQDITGPAPSAGIRFFNWSVTAPSLHYWADDMKLTSTLSTACLNTSNPPVTATDTACVTEGIQSTAGIAFGGVSSGRRYTGIEPGSYTFTGRLTSVAPGTIVSSVPGTIEAGKYYSYFTSGVYNTTTRTADGFIVEDPIPVDIDWTVTNVRLVNAVHNAPAVTLYAKNVETGVEYTLGGAVAYKGAGEFVAIPPGAYDLRARATGATTDSFTRANVAFERGRHYTIATRGDFTSTSTTAASRRFLDSTINR